MGQYQGPLVLGRDRYKRVIAKYAAAGEDLGELDGAAKAGPGRSPLLARLC